MLPPGISLRERKKANVKYFLSFSLPFVGKNNNNIIYNYRMLTKVSMKEKQGKGDNFSNLEMLVSHFSLYSDIKFLFDFQKK